MVAENTEDALSTSLPIPISNVSSQEANKSIAVMPKKNFVLIALIFKLLIFYLC